MNTFLCFSIFLFKNSGRNKSMKPNISKLVNSLGMCTVVFKSTFVCNACLMKKKETIRWIYLFKVLSLFRSCCSVHFFFRSEVNSNCSVSLYLVIVCLLSFYVLRFFFSFSLSLATSNYGLVLFRQLLFHLHTLHMCTWYKSYWFIFFSMFYWIRSK